MRTGIADRAAGALLGMAAGDALGAGYEFGPAMSAATDVEMAGGGSFGWEPGEWTDDTQMAVPLLEAAELAAASGTALTDHLDHVARRWVDWAVTAADVGNQTRSVLATVRHSGDLSAAALSHASHALHALTRRTAGNGSLMRTAPVALAYLSDPSGLASAAREVSSLTHWDGDAGDACVLWCLAIRRAVLHGAFDLSGGLDALPEERRTTWAARIASAESSRPRDFPENGWVVHAFQGAWSAITTTKVPDGDPPLHLRLALENAVRGGGDTDTVAAIAGQLLGARWGATAVPMGWTAKLHGWPGMTGDELADRGAGLVASDRI